MGKDEGGVVFEIGGVKNGQAVTCRFGVVAHHDGGLIPAVLASIAAHKLLEGRLSAKGLVPVHRGLSSHELVDELRLRDLRLWWQPPGESRWRPFVLDVLR